MTEAQSQGSQRDTTSHLVDYSKLISDRRVAAHWMDGGRFWFVEGAPRDTVIQVFDVQSGTIAPLLDVPRTRAALETLLGRPLPYRGLPFEAVALDNANGAFFMFEGVGYRLDRETYSVALSETTNAIDDHFGNSPRMRAQPKTFMRANCFGDLWEVPEMGSPDGRWFASVRDHNLCLRGTFDGRSELLTRDGAEGHDWDLQSILGKITRSWASPWSPDGLKIFATKFDARAVAPVSRTQILGFRDEVEWLRVARAGDVLPTSEPFIVDVLDRRPVRLNVEFQDRFLVFIGWRSGGREVYFAQFARYLREATVYRGDAVSGDVQAVFTETSDSFIRIQHDIIFGCSGCTILPDDEGLLWESERDGWKHLYHYGPDGSLRRQLTSGAWPVCTVQGVEWPVSSVLNVDTKGGFVYFTAHHDQQRPYDVHLCRVPLAGGTVERLTEGEGVHDIQLAPDFRAFVATTSKPDKAPRSEVRDTNGRRIHTFAATDTTRLEAAGWTAPEEFRVKAADGETDLWGVLYKPNGFDPAMRYPVIEYIYAGPQAVAAPHFFQVEAEGTATLRQLGYVVVVLDARGTPERSKAFHDAVFRDWRRHVTADHAAALRNLAKERPWMDMGRVGVWGHSWGGYYAVASLLDNPDLYKAGVASAPSLDPYSLFLSEPYLDGVPGPDNKALYDDADLIRNAADLKGELMMAVGTNDVATWRDAIKMSHALIEAGKQHEFVVLPAQYHAYGSASTRYLGEKLVTFFERHVRNG